MIWGNRMIESRLAVAQQLNEISHIMQQVAEDLYDISAAEPVFQEELARSLRKRHVILKRAWVMEGRRAQTDFSDHARQKRTVCCCIRNLADFVRDMRMHNDLGTGEPLYCEPGFPYGSLCGGCQLSDAVWCRKAYQRKGKSFRR